MALVMQLAQQAPARFAVSSTKSTADAHSSMSRMAPIRLPTALDAFRSSSAPVERCGRGFGKRMTSATRLKPLNVLYNEDGQVKDGNVQQFSDSESFDKILAEAGDKLIVVDVATTTCGPCKMIYPKVVELSVKYPDVVFLKIFGDQGPEARNLMRAWGVRAVPLFRFYRNGQLIHSHTGAKAEELYKNFDKYYTQAKV